jgi:hypothetical protein
MKIKKLDPSEQGTSQIEGTITPFNFQPFIHETLPDGYVINYISEVT